MTEYDALRGEMAAGFAALQRSLDEVKEKQDHTNGRVRDLELFRAQVKGFLLAIGLAAGFPSLILTVVLIFDRI